MTLNPGPKISDDDINYILESLTDNLACFPTPDPVFAVIKQMGGIPRKFVIEIDDNQVEQELGIFIIDQEAPLRVSKTPLFHIGCCDSGFYTTKTLLKCLGKRLVTKKK